MRDTVPDLAEFDYLVGIMAASFLAVSSGGNGAHGQGHGFPMITGYRLAEKMHILQAVHAIVTIHRDPDRRNQDTG